MACDANPRCSAADLEAAGLMALYQSPCPVCFEHSDRVSRPLRGTNPLPTNGPVQIVQDFLVCLACLRVPLGLRTPREVIFSVRVRFSGYRPGIPFDTSQPRYPGPPIPAALHCHLRALGLLCQHPRPGQGFQI